MRHTSVRLSERHPKLIKSTGKGPTEVHSTKCASIRDFTGKNVLKSEPQPPMPACACTLGPHRSWTVVFLGIILVILAVDLDLSLEAVLIIGLIPLAVLVASAVSGRGRP